MLFTFMGAAWLSNPYHYEHYCYYYYYYYYYQYYYYYYCHVAKYACCIVGLCEVFGGYASAAELHCSGVLVFLA